MGGLQHAFPDHLGHSQNFTSSTVIRLEWVHAVAAVERWQEEVKLLREEARRLPVSFRHEVAQWRVQEVRDLTGYPTPVQAGFVAHARRKVALFKDLARVASGYSALF